MYRPAYFPGKTVGQTQCPQFYKGSVLYEISRQRLLTRALVYEAGMLVGPVLRTPGIVVGIFCDVVVCSHSSRHRTVFEFIQNVLAIDPVEEEIKTQSFPCKGIAYTVCKIREAFSDYRLVIGRIDDIVPADILQFPVSRFRD